MNIVRLARFRITFAIKVKVLDEFTDGLKSIIPNIFGDKIAAQMNLKNINELFLIIHINT